MKKFYFAYDGEVKFAAYYDDNAQAFEKRCEMEKKDNHNWKVYDERFNLVYGVAICKQS